jgi:hypothetical protein
MPFLRKGFLKSAHHPNRTYCNVDPIPYFGLTFVLLFIVMIIPTPRHGAGPDLARVSRHHHSRWHHLFSKLPCRCRRIAEQDS